MISVSIGQIIKLQPWTDLWMRDGTTARITTIRRGAIFVAPIVGAQEVKQRFRISRSAIDFGGEP